MGKCRDVREETTELTEAFQFLDTSTEFLFGESVNSLDNPDMVWPQQDTRTALAGFRVRLQLSSFVFLHRDSKWLAACNRIQTFFDQHIDKAYAQLDEKRKGGLTSDSDRGPRKDLLWTLAHQIPNKDELRAHLTGVWIPSNETTSILISNTIFALARHPEVTQKLRKEIVNYGDRLVTFEGLRSLQYLKWVINESRLQHLRRTSVSRRKAKLTSVACTA